MERTVIPRAGVSAGIIAGLGGGILTDLFLILAQAAFGTNGGDAGGGFARFIASALLGAPGMTNPAAVGIGVVLQLCVAVGWALGYVYLVRREPQLLARPWLSGAAFGLVVYTFVKIVGLGSGLYHPPNPFEIGISLIAYIGFYGIAVALILSRLLRNA